MQEREIYRPCILIAILLIFSSMEVAYKIYILLGKTSYIGDALKCMF